VLTRFGTDRCHYSVDVGRPGRHRRAGLRGVQGWWRRKNSIPADLGISRFLVPPIPTVARRRDGGYASTRSLHGVHRDTAAGAIQQPPDAVRAGERGIRIIAGTRGEPHERPAPVVPVARSDSASAFPLTVSSGRRPSPRTIRFGMVVPGVAPSNGPRRRARLSAVAGIRHRVLPVRADLTPTNRGSRGDTEIGHVLARLRGRRPSVDAAPFMNKSSPKSRRGRRDFPLSAGPVGSPPGPGKTGRFQSAGRAPMSRHQRLTTIRAVGGIATRVLLVIQRQASIRLGGGWRWPGGKGPGRVRSASCPIGNGKASGDVPAAYPDEIDSPVDRRGARRTVFAGSPRITDRPA